MTQLSISNIVNVSVSIANLGVNAYNTSNLAIVTGEPVTPAVQTITFSGVSASGAFILMFGTLPTSSLAYNATAAEIQTAINALSGLSHVLVSGSIASKTLTLTQPGQFGSIPVPTIPTNTLQTAGSVAITLSPATVSSGWSGSTFGYAIYATPTEVGDDFGTSSITFKQANAVFSQQPNILAGNGQLIALLRDVTQQTITLSSDPTGGAFVLVYDGHSTASIAWDATTAQIQAYLRAIAGLEEVIVTGQLASGFLTVFFNGVYGPAEALSVTSNTLVVGTVPVTFAFETTVDGETFGEAITRTQGLVNYFGVMPNETLAVIGQVDMLAAASIILPLNIIGYFVSYNTADIRPGGMIDLLISGSFRNSRGLYYGDSSSDGINAIIFMSSYAGLGLSVNFNGSNTTTTMNLKTLFSVQPDPTMTQTIYNLAKAAGADIYVSFQGAPSVVCNGANQFYDQVYNLHWFYGAVQVADFNFLAQSATKIPQTESGMDGLKGASRTVCVQAVNNGYIAPGRWTSSTTFGNQALFLENIEQYGYYIYATPISQQLAAARAGRQAPLIQIALKEAGAIHSANVIVYVNP